MLSVNQLMSSSAGLAQPGGSGAALLSSQQTASSAEVCSITTCVTSELGRGWGEGGGPGLSQACHPSRFTPYVQGFALPGGHLLVLQMASSQKDFPALFLAALCSSYNHNPSLILCCPPTPENGVPQVQGPGVFI